MAKETLRRTVIPVNWVEQKSVPSSSDRGLIRIDEVPALVRWLRGRRPMTWLQVLLDPALLRDAVQDWRRYGPREQAH